MRTILYNPVFINPLAYYVFPLLYDIEPKTDDFVEPAVYAGRLVVNSIDADLSGVYNGEKEIDFSKYAGNSIRISQYTDDGSTVLGEWRLPTMNQEIDFTVLNYDKGMESAAIDSLNIAIQQSAALLNNWKPTTNSLRLKFQANLYMLFCPVFDTSNVKDWYRAFNNCPVIYVPKLDTSSTTTLEAAFWDAKNLSYIPDLDYSVSDNMKNVFRGMNLRSGEYTIKIKDNILINGMLGNIKDIDKKGLKFIIEGSPLKVDELVANSEISELVIDLSNTTSTAAIVRNAYELRIFRSPNFGKSAATSWDFDVRYFGIDNDTTNGEAYKALIETFVTGSYDRLANNMPECTIKFSSPTKALFTEEHIEIMKNKGYNIA